MNHRCTPLLWIAFHYLLFLVDITPFTCGAANSNDDSDVDDPSKRIFVNGDVLVIGGAVFLQHPPQQLRTSIESSCRQGNDMACLYDETLQRVKTSAIEMEELSSAANGDYNSDENLDKEFDLVSMLAQDLLLMGSFHREQLDDGLVSALAHDQDSFSDSSDTLTKEHYVRAMGAFHAALYYYRKMWSIMNEQPPTRTQDVYDLHPVLLANFGVALQLSDLYERYYQVFHEAPQSDGTDAQMAADAAAREAYSLSYRYLLTSEHWCVKSQSLLESITSYEEKEEEKQNKHTMYNNDPYEKLYRRQVQEQHQLYVYETNQSLAATNVRIGTLLLTMYAEGYTLTSEEMLKHEPAARTILLNSFGYIIDEEQEDYTDEIIDTIKLDQERLLLRIIDRIKHGISIYEESAVNANLDLEDNRINIADSYYHLGMAYQYLGDYKSAISEWETSLDLYRTVFNEYTSSPSTNAELIVDVVQSLITTSQQCRDASLSLGHYEKTKAFFRLNLTLRRYLEEGVSMEEALDHNKVDDVEDNIQEDEEDSIDYQYDQFFGGSTQFVDDSIHQHQTMLDEYYKTLLNHPDGSYHEVTLDIDGSEFSSMEISDRVYEGSLRSVIGSLYLAKNDVRAARDELELAVVLLRKGMEDELRGVWDTKAQDIDGNELSIPLYLADALLNLSYAQCGLKQWHKSMSSFEDALDMFAKELPEGENPFDYKNKDRGHKSREPPQRDNLLERMKSKYSIRVENFDLRGNSTIGSEDD